MKKSILFGALAFFAVSAMSIQDVNAQNEVKADSKKVESVSEKQEKPSSTKVAQEPVKKKDDCCAEKKVSADKKADCCADKKVSEKKESKDCCADKKMKAEEKKVRAEDKRIRPKEGVVKPEFKKNKKAAVKSDKSDK